MRHVDCLELYTVVSTNILSHNSLNANRRVVVLVWADSFFIILSGIIFTLKKNSIPNLFYYVQKACD